ncbi:class I SAM-dependent methyltransferase [Hyperthermus butylicus]|uniref:Ubiquinone/menaquinone biosynthesis methyl transferase n=1 Tax=Hyperthermus butylicus (strain DSM 5456 / JCM 9403 / PLM1-5) TaxID=415426 RepID=A2BIV9_HYPBU|nr:class I SAM-dependent methyltransferase [Hyperthermus butylicus]ABM79920.1 putative ubiquinone/menaquinone biosynthesis methyl transferase [Hyperthermus butylicus DSM 5456]
MRRLDISFWRKIISDIEAIISYYRRMNRIMSLGHDEKVRCDAVQAICRHTRCMLVLDVGAGPGDSVRCICKVAKPAYIVAVEPSSRMVRLSCRACRHVCDAVVAIAESLPFRSTVFDAVTSFYAARDYLNLTAALREERRVACGGVVIGDIFVPASKLLRLLQKIWVCVFAPFIALIVAAGKWKPYTTLCRTLSRWLTIGEMGSMLCSGYEVCEQRAYVVGGLGYVAAWQKSACGDNRG